MSYTRLLSKKLHNIAKLAITGVTSVAMVACASSKNPNDPYEAYNRQVFNLNMKFDTYVLRPITIGYVSFAPEPIRNVIANFYNNLRDFVTLGDDILQLEGMNSMQTTMRIGLNSTFGLLGIIDVASSMGLPQHKNTFGNTMKVWGWNNSSYFMVPLYGPGTIRDELGIGVDIFFNPMWYLINDDWISGGLFGINLINMRSKYLGQDQLLEQSLDPYATIRDMYLQHSGEYIYPTNTESKNISDSDNIDALINDENGQSNAKITKPATQNSDNSVDALIADENNQIPAASSFTASSATIAAVNNSAKVTTTTLNANPITTNSSYPNTNNVDDTNNNDANSDNVINNWSNGYGGKIVTY